MSKQNIPPFAHVSFILFTPLFSVALIKCSLNENKTENLN